MIRIVDLHCWHANELIYQAEGHTDDSRYIHVRYRRPWFSVGVGDTPDDAAKNDNFVSNSHPDFDPSRITLHELRSWTVGVFSWPHHIEGYSNAVISGG